MQRNQYQRSPDSSENGATSPGYAPNNRAAGQNPESKSPENNAMKHSKTTNTGIKKSPSKQSSNVQNNRSSPTLQKKLKRLQLQKMYSQIYPDGKAHVSLLTQTRLVPPPQYQSPRRIVRPDDSEASSQITETLEKAHNKALEEARNADTTANTESKEDLKEGKKEEEDEGYGINGKDRGNLAVGSPSSGGSATHQTGESERTDQMLFHRTPGLRMGERVPYMQQAQSAIPQHHSSKKAMEYFNRIKHSVK